MTTPHFVRTLADALSSHAPRVYVCVDRQPGVAELYALARAGWQVAAEGSNVTLRRPGRSIRWISQWVGRRDDVHPVNAYNWWMAMDAALSDIAPGARLFGSPGTVGRDLWLRTLRGEYPVLGPAWQDTIRQVAGQGRFQMFDPGTETIGNLCEVDARLAYLSCTSNLPVGEPRWWKGVWSEDAAEFFEVHGYMPGWVRAEWCAPAGWDRPGILTGAPDGEGKPTWPMASFTPQWVSLASLQLATQRYTWQAQIFEGFWWKQTGSPLRSLVRAILDRLNGDYDREVIHSPLWRAGWRAIALHTIGAMFGAPRKVSHIVCDDEAIPDDALDVKLMPGDCLVRYHTLEDAQWPETHHPEWTATIWERARVRLLDAAGVGERVGALHCPPGSVIGMRTDALYLDHDPEWVDDGKPGRYRVKRYAVGPHDTPHTQADMLAILDGDV